MKYIKKMEYLIFRVLNKLSSKINDSFLINMRIWLFKRNCLDLSDYNGTIFRTDLEESYQTFLSKNELSDKKYMNIILNDIIQGVVAIPRSSYSAHIRENGDIFDFYLTNYEMQMIDSLNQNKSYGCLTSK